MSLIAMAVIGCGPRPEPLEIIANKQLPAPARGLYVSATDAIIAAVDARRRLVAFARERRITRAVFYGLGPILGDPDAEAALLALFGDLRAAGVTELLAPVVSPARVDALIAFERRRGATLDGLVTELEYWNHCTESAVDTREVRPCARELVELLDAMDRAAASRPAARPLLRGVYLGYPSAAEAALIAERADFVALNYHIRDPALAHRHRHRAGGALADRLARFARAGVAVWPIFYARGEVDMRATLARRGMAAVETQFTAGTEHPIAGFLYFAFDPEPGALTGTAP